MADITWIPLFQQFNILSLWLLWLLGFNILLTRNIYFITVRIKTEIREVRIADLKDCLFYQTIIKSQTELPDNNCNFKMIWILETYTETFLQQLYQFTIFSLRGIEVIVCAHYTRTWNSKSIFAPLYLNIGIPLLLLSKHSVV